MEHLNLWSWVGLLGSVIGNALLAHPPFLFGGHAEWGTQRILGIVIAVIHNIFNAATFITIRYRLERRTLVISQPVGTLEKK